MSHPRYVRSSLLVFTLLALLPLFPDGPRPVTSSSSSSVPDFSAPAAISSDRAIAAALNAWEATADGWTLRHPRHTASFTSQGIQFTPRRGGPTWAWRLTHVGAEGVTSGPTTPRRNPSGVVTYSRGSLLEQYLAGKNTIEQQFLLPQPLQLHGRDLVISGAIRSTGAFEAAQGEWCWAGENGAVRLGDVHVFDAAGKKVPAHMSVTASESRIVVDGAALAHAVYPVTIDPEIGSNDFRISFMGRDLRFDAKYPAIAFNTANSEYLVVWEGDANDGLLVDGKYEIYGQRINAANGDRIGAPIRISTMGPEGDASYGAFSPAVAYNSRDNQYLVVWYGDDNALPLADNEYEIFGQRLSAEGALAGVNGFRISDMGPNGDTGYVARFPRIAYNSVSNEYLVVWEGTDNTPPLVSGEFEIFGQRISAAGVSLGTNDFRISDMGPDGNTQYGARTPAVAYSTKDNSYLVVWSGDDNTAPLVHDEFEIFGQILDAPGGSIGTNDFRISSMGPDGNINYRAEFPAAAYNSLDNEYLVVWSGDTHTGSLVDEEYEIFGQLVSAHGNPIGSDDFRVSSMGPNGDTRYWGTSPAIAYHPFANDYLVVWMGVDDAPSLGLDSWESFGARVWARVGGVKDSDAVCLSQLGTVNTAHYAVRPAVAQNTNGHDYLVVWQGKDDQPALGADEEEIFGQRVSMALWDMGTSRIRISFMGYDDSADAEDAAVAYNSSNNEYLVVWSGDDGTPPMVDEEHEIWGQRINGATGALIGRAFRISDMGPDGDFNYNATTPAVAYSSHVNEYLVVWSGDDNTPPLVQDEFEIFGQRLSAAGAQVGTNDFRISRMGPDANALYDASAPRVVYNYFDYEYLVVWSGDSDTGSLVDQEFEIFGQRLSTSGVALGSSGFRISNAMGPDGNTNYAALGPALAYNPRDNQYLVVWYGDDNVGGLVDGEFEIFGQLLSNTGAEVVGNDFRISSMGPTGSSLYSAFWPAVAHNIRDNQYLVVWYGDDSVAPLVNNEYEVFGQLLSNTGAKVGISDFRISTMGTDGSTLYNAYRPEVGYNSERNRYLVVWYADDNAGSLIDGEFEIFGQMLGADGSRGGFGSVRLSTMGPHGNANYAANHPALAFNGRNNEFLIVWGGDDNTLPLVNDEFEIFGQRFNADYWLLLPLIFRGS